LIDSVTTRLNLDRPVYCEDGFKAIRSRLTESELVFLGHFQNPRIWLGSEYL